MASRTEHGQCTPRVRPLALVGLLAVFACSGPPPAAPKQGSKSDAPPSRVERLLPLLDDSILAYDTELEDTGERGVLMMHVARPREDRVDLTVGGRVRRLEIAPEGIRYLDGGYILREPIDLHATWQGKLGTVTVSAVNVATETPAGKFLDCVETVEEAASSAGSNKVTTLYCPDVGITRIRIESAEGQEYRLESAVLRSFGKRVDIYDLAE